MWACCIMWELGFCGVEGGGGGICSMVSHIGMWCEWLEMK